MELLQEELQDQLSMYSRRGSVVLEGAGYTTHRYSAERLEQSLMKMKAMSADFSGSVKYRFTRLFPDHLSMTDTEAQLARVMRLRDFCLMLCGVERSDIPRTKEEHEKLIGPGKRPYGGRQLSIREVSRELGIPMSSFRMWCDIEVIKNGKPTILQRDPLEMPFRLMLLLAPQDLPDDSPVTQKMTLPAEMLDWSGYDLHYWLVTGENPPPTLSAHTRVEEVIPSDYLDVLSRLRTPADWKDAFRLLLNAIPYDEELAEEAQSMIRKHFDDRLYIYVDWARIDRLAESAIERMGLADAKAFDVLWESVAKVSLPPESQIFNVMQMLTEHRAGPELFENEEAMRLLSHLLGGSLEELRSCLTYAGN